VRERYDLPVGRGKRGDFPSCSTTGCGGGGWVVGGDADPIGDTDCGDPAAVKERRGELRSVVSDGVHSVATAGFGLRGYSTVQEFQGAAAGSTQV
jgi:hypothetical protein